MKNITIKDLVNFTGGDPSKDLDLELQINSISNDSRTVDENWVYLALKGERLDGHRFVEDAKKNGAILSIVEQENFPKSIRVKNSYQALKDIALHYKKRYRIPCVAVTGSSGKTTTKDMIFYALNESKPTLRNIGNLNSEIGLPMTVLNLEENHSFAVFEMGMYQLGEIDYLAEIVQPDIGVITNIGTAHILNLKTRENILKAKMEISNYMSEKNVLLINGDNDLLQSLDKNSVKPEVITFGLSGKNDIRALSYKFSDAKTYIKADVLGEIIEFVLPTLGEHNILNALSALGVCKRLNLDLSVSAQGLSKYSPSRYRMEKSEIGGKVLINDSYNANPDSMRAAISTLNHMTGKRKVAILADMLELGDESERYHREIGEFVTEYADFLITIGAQAKFIEEGARESGMKEDMLKHFDFNEEAFEEINRLLEEGDIIMLKGSRGMKLEEVAEKIR